MPPDTERFSWVRTAVLWQARRDTQARLFGDPSLRQRPRWAALARSRGATPDFVVDRTDLVDPSFAVLGDTGEGDASQYAVVPPLLAVAGDTDFMIVASDVVYPAGAKDEYAAKFLHPYNDYRAPIYAVPGNHDWYDGLEGFMACFCGLPESLVGGRPPVQPASYFALDTAALRIIGIDVGILGRLDAAQGAWLRRVAYGRSVPKLLVSGKPIYADARHDPLPIKGGGTVDEIVRDPRAGFVAALAGDVHNYQRYPVHVDGRTLQYVVCGGGGAYTNETHSIPRVDLPGVTEDDVRLYPLRGDSLSYYSKRFQGWWRTASERVRRGGPDDVTLEPGAAARIIADRLGTEPVRPATATVDERAIAAAERVFPAAGYRGWNRWFSQYWDADDPPLFKSFLRLDVDGSTLVLRCFAATGCAEHETDPPVEDEVAIPLA
jgi:calcineurin-like phosphoesterase family protein